MIIRKYAYALAVFVAAFLFISNAGAQMPPLGLPGTIRAIGTHFEINDSGYLNVALDSSEEISLLYMESAPEMITMTMESASAATTTQLTISGLTPDTTFYKYEDNYHNITPFTVDGNGVYTYTQDISTKHYVFIQLRASTKFIADNATGGDCATIGTWNAATKTCTLTTNVFETIQIDSNGITLDGNGHTITGSDTGVGIYLPSRSGVTVKNLTTTQFTYGIMLASSINNTITGVVAQQHSRGVFLTSSQGNTITGNILANKQGLLSTTLGVFINGSTDDTVSNNSISGDQTSLIDTGIYVYGSNSVVVEDNIITNGNGIILVFGAGDTIRNNNVNPNSAGNSQSIGLFASNNETVTNNTIGTMTISESQGGVIVHDNTIIGFAGSPYPNLSVVVSSNFQIYNNNIINPNPIVFNSAGVFNLPSPVGGNFWSNYSISAQGCFDASGDGFCDSSLSLPNGNQDALPWTSENGWTINAQAANLAKKLVNSSYILGGKGWDYNQKEFVAPSTVKSGYVFATSAGIISGAGVDCSGLIMWAYDRSFDPNKSRFDNFVKAEGADEQFRYNTTSTTEARLRSGDAMFFDFDNNNFIDHVAMYVGDSGGYDVVSALNINTGIVGRFKDNLKQPGTGFIAFKRVISALPPSLLITGGSPIDLVVTDPDGFTITPTTTVASDLEYLRQIPGVLYYSEMEKGEDGNPIDQVYSYVAKTGDYAIAVLPAFGTAPTATYTLDFSVGSSSIILAENEPISQIPANGYGITISPTGTTSSFIPMLIDVKPGSYPNSINLGSNGVVPVVIFGSATFDVHQIDPATIKLANSSIQFRGNGQPQISYSDINEDGFTDVVVQVSTEALQLTSSDVKAELEGWLIDGTMIKGSDSVRIVPE